MIYKHLAYKGTVNFTNHRREVLENWIIIKTHLSVMVSLQMAVSIRK